jgi:glycosyltransferase involved in cell wall biosynthesis
MPQPTISVVMPARNEGARVLATLRSILATRTLHGPIEIVIVDDASEDGCCGNLIYDIPALQQQHPGLAVRIRRLHERSGVAPARNEGAALARGDVLFITDSHVAFCPGWDAIALEHLRPNRVLAAATADPDSAFRGYGCSLVVPFMGTRWNRARPSAPQPVQIAASHGTVLTRELFERIGGYDAGMLYYAAAEPEFSLRAWLAGAEVVAVPALEVAHRFKPREERASFLAGMRPYMTHNSLRFGALYLSERAFLQLLRYFTIKFPRDIRRALELFEESDVWQRKAQLEARLVRGFDWFAERFGVRDEAGQRILA